MTDKDKYFQESISSGIPTYYFLLRDFGVGKGCKNFVETGTHLGNGVQYALDNGFDEVLSCEMMQDRYQHCMDRFKDNDNVSLWLGKSDDCFSEMVSKLTEKSCFWLDAHAEGGGVPTFEELDVIKNSSIKDHTIIIDDIPVYFVGKVAALEQKLLSINEDYIIEYFPVDLGGERGRVDDYELVAYV